MRHREQHKAGVDRAITGVSARVWLEHHHCTGSTIALGTAFFGAAEVRVAQVVQHREIGVYLAHPHNFAIDRKLEGGGILHLSFSLLERQCLEC